MDTVAIANSVTNTGALHRQHIYIQNIKWAQKGETMTLK